MKADMLEALGDDDLRAVIARAEELLQQHDTERKDKATAEARALLAAVGLTFKDLSGNGKKTAAKGAVYRVGQIYQHPADRSLTWAGKGKKPSWLTQLEADGGRAVEAANDNHPAPLKKAG